MRRSSTGRRKGIFGRKKGFTLVEVLVVVVIIGALSGILMFSAVSALDKAEATKIVSDLKNIQSASILYFADNAAWPADDITLIDPYLSAKLNADSKYSLVNKDGAVQAAYQNDEISANVMNRLKDMQDKGSPISVDVAGKSVAINING